MTVRQIETGATRTLATNGDGRFYAPSVPVGDYLVTVKRDGFQTDQQSGISLAIGQSLQLNFVLGVETVQQQIVVDAAQSSVNTTTQQTSGLIDERQVKELPLNGRSYDELLTLNPATVNYTDERSGGIGTSNSSVGNMFSVSGRRPQDNLFLLNGIEYTGASLINVTPGGTSGQLLGVDAVREFNVVTDTYGASYGKRDGAQVSIVTTSGTNQLHGTAFEFIRNSALDARNYFDQGDQFRSSSATSSADRWADPFATDKLFLFGNYEGFRQNWGLSAVTLVPDNQARAGLSAQLRGRGAVRRRESSGRSRCSRCGRCRMARNSAAELPKPSAIRKQTYPRRLRHHALRRQPQRQGPAVCRLHRRRQHRQHAVAESAEPA